MRKIYLISIILIALILAGAVAAPIGIYFVYNKSNYYQPKLPNYNQPEEQIVCTQEAKLCPDGSYVLRQGPKCEFAKCPQVASTGTIKGKVNVGPICPVETYPPDPSCQPKPETYTSREVILYLSDGVTELKRMHFLPDGTYSFQVSPGTYVINIPYQGVGGSKDLPKTITVKLGQTIEFNFSIDTGIR